MMRSGLDSHLLQSTRLQLLIDGSHNVGRQQRMSDCSVLRPRVGLELREVEALGIGDADLVAGRGGEAKEKAIATTADSRNIARIEVFI